MTVRVYVSSSRGHRIPRRLVEKAARFTLRSEGALEGELSVTFLSDDPMRELNRTWLEHDYVTDVLSFALHDPGAPPVGDIYVGVGQAERQAAENGASRNEELVRLVVHGALHVLGFDHGHGAVGGEFERKQEALVSELVGERVAGQETPAKARP